APTAEPATCRASLRDLTGDPCTDALARGGYAVGRGSADPGASDTAPLTANSTITDASIRAAIQADVTKGLVKAPDANRLYLVFVQPNVAVSLSRRVDTKHGILGYHDAFAGKDASGQVTTIRYAVIASPGGTVGNSTLAAASVAGDQLTAVASHELAEAVTDPDGGLGQVGWYDPYRGEIADITQNSLTHLDGYLVQQVA